MDQLYEIYSKIKEAHSHKRVLDLTHFANLITETLIKASDRIIQCQALGQDIETDPIFNDIISKKYQGETHTARITKEEQILLDSQIIRSINLNTGDIVPCYDYIYDYSSLTFEQFQSYLYWRTQIRKGCSCETPLSYMRLYLIELCNFIEFDSVEKTQAAMLHLVSLSSTKKVRSAVYDALSEFLVYYGEKEAVAKYDSCIWQFKKVKSCLSYLSGTHTRPFDFITDRASYKIKNSDIFQENPTLVEVKFLDFFSDVLLLLKQNGVDLIPLWVGKYELARPGWSGIIKKVYSDRVIEKQFIEDGIVLREVTKDSLLEANMTSLGDDVDPGQKIFNSTYIINYMIMAFENELRKNSGKEQLCISTEKIRSTMSYKDVLLEKIVETYESPAFFDCIKQNID